MFEGFIRQSLVLRSSFIAEFQNIEIGLFDLDHVSYQVF